MGEGGKSWTSLTLKGYGPLGLADSFFCCSRSLWNKWLQVWLVFDILGAIARISTSTYHHLTSPALGNSTISHHSHVTSLSLQVMNCHYESSPVRVITTWHDHHFKESLLQCPLSPRHLIHSLSLSLSHISLVLYMFYTSSFCLDQCGRNCEKHPCVFFGVNMCGDLALHSPHFSKPLFQDHANVTIVGRDSSRVQNARRVSRGNAEQIPSSLAIERQICWWTDESEKPKIWLNHAETKSLTTFKQTIPELHPWQANMLKKCLKSCPSNHNARFCSAWGITCYSWSAGTILQVSPCGSMLTM